jgi:hypothetical protein
MKRILFFLSAFLFTLGLSAQVKVYTPTLKSPANNDTAKMPNVTLSWNAISGSTGLKYELQLDTVTTFDSPMLKDTVQELLTGYTTSELYFNQVYYWRVRAIDMGETSYWSSTWNFKVFDWVELDKPNPNATGSNPNETLKWKTTIKSITITGVQYFDYQADTSLLFNSPLLIQGTVASTVFQGATSNMRFGATYYWRVRARHSKGHSDYCAPRSFTVIDKFTLASPGNNAVDQFLDVALKWNAVTGLLAYGYQIAHDQNFTDIVTEGEVNDVSVDATFLNFGGVYYWRINGRHVSDTSQWSDPYKFTAIDRVILIAPANAATDVALSPLVTWTKQTGITGYELQIDSLNTFGNPVVSAKPTSTSVNYQVTKKLKPLTTYYWRMRAFSDGTLMADTSNWSSPFSFVTTSATGIDEAESSSFNIYPNPAREKLFIRLNARENNQVRFMLVDLVGRRVIDTPLDLTPGENIKEISLDNISDGIYIARLQIGSDILNQKIIVGK